MRKTTLLVPVAAVLAAAGLDLAGAALVKATKGVAPPASPGLDIPASIKAEHEELHAQLERLGRARGRVGEAARRLAAVMHPHFVREEQIALPPLGLLRPLAQGEPAADAARALAMTDSLRAELPQMLKEHEGIAAAARRLGAAGKAAHDARAQAFAKQLLQHARSEEEVLYPAAVLVGDVIRARATVTRPAT